MAQKEERYVMEMIELVACALTVTILAMVTVGLRYKQDCMEEDISELRYQLMVIEKELDIVKQKIL